MHDLFDTFQMTVWRDSVLGGSSPYQNVTIEVDRFLELSIEGRTYAISRLTRYCTVSSRRSSAPDLEEQRSEWQKTHLRSMPPYF